MNKNRLNAEIKKSSNADSLLLDKIEVLENQGTIKGDKGDKGDRGLTGLTGLTGADGLDGLDGDDFNGDARLNTVESLVEDQGKGFKVSFVGQEGVIGFTNKTYGDNWNTQLDLVTKKTFRGSQSAHALTNNTQDIDIANNTNAINAIGASDYRLKTFLLGGQWVTVTSEEQAKSLGTVQWKYSGAKAIALGLNTTELHSGRTAQEWKSIQGDNSFTNALMHTVAAGQSYTHADGVTVTSPILYTDAELSADPSLNNDSVTIDTGFYTVDTLAIVSDHEDRISSNTNRIGGIDMRIDGLETSISDSDAMSAASGSLVYGPRGFGLAVGHSGGRSALAAGFRSRDFNLTATATKAKKSIGFGWGF